MADRANYALLFQILDALTHDEFSGVRARLKDLFDKGGLAVRIVMSQNNEEQARRLVETLDRYGALEEYRRDIVKQAALMKYPDAARAAGRSRSTRPRTRWRRSAASCSTSRTSRSPRTRRRCRPRARWAICARTSSTRPRARAPSTFPRASASWPRRSRACACSTRRSSTPASVRVGTKVELCNGDVRRDVTILGPWESDPERGVYSNQSEVARKLMGHAAGDIVSFMGNDYLIESIRKWNE